MFHVRLLRTWRPLFWNYFWNYCNVSSSFHVPYNNYKEEEDDEEEESKEESEEEAGKDKDEEQETDVVVWSYNTIYSGC